MLGLFSLLGYFWSKSYFTNSNTESVMNFNVS